jgi:uncharacterized protein YcnI
MLISHNGGRFARRVAVVVGGCAVALVAVAGTASAHVTVTPGSVAQGSTAELTFKVPNEEDTATTTRIDMRIPIDHPIAQLLVRPVPGWTVQVKTVKLAKPVVTDDGSFGVAVSEVIWSGGQIPPGQYQDFAVSADPLPSGVTQVVFKTLQTYSNGDIVRWIDTAQPGQPEPDHPAPVLRLTSGTDTAAVAVRNTATPPSSSDGGGDGTTRALAVAALVCGVLGVAIGVVGRRSRRKPRRS